MASGTPRDYSVAIRTLGKAGEKYQALLNSLIVQTIKPKDIFVYLADGYDMPKETVGIEKVMYVKKGMLAQRALQYDEIDSEYILLLDDDVYLPPTAVEHLFDQLDANRADVISPDVFPNSSRSISSRILMTLSGRMIARHRDNKWGYRVLPNGGYSYNLHPHGALLSQTNAGPCCLCRKNDLLNTHLSQESWIDDMPYALGEDQVMYYKMYKQGLKMLTSYDSGIEHLDAGSSTASYDKEKTLAYCDARFKLIFWHRYLLMPERYCCKKVLLYLSLGYTILFNLGVSLVKLNSSMYQSKLDGYINAIQFIKSSNYKQLSRI